jgi:hypothetical protein
VYDTVRHAGILRDVWYRRESISQDQPFAAGKAVTRNQKAGAAQRSEPPTVGGSSLQPLQFEERLRIAERIVQALHEVGTRADWRISLYPLAALIYPPAIRRANTISMTRPRAAAPAAWRCGGDPPRLVARHQSRRRSPAELLLEIDVRQRVVGGASLRPAFDTFER